VETYVFVLALHSNFVLCSFQDTATSESLVKSEFLYTLLAHIIAPISVNFESNRL